MRRLGSCLWLAVAGLLGMYLCAAAWSTLERLRSSSEYLYGEAIVLDEVRRIGLGQPLYPAPDAVPLTVTAYPPAYYLVVAGLQHLAGDTGYGPGRVVSVVATLAAGGLLAWSVRQLAASWPGGLLAAGLFFTQNLTALLWAPAHRVDPLALCLSLFGIALATCGRTSLAALPLAAAVLTKPTYLAAPLAVVLTLWPARRSVFAFAGLFIGTLCACVGVGVWLTHGELLWHTVVANANPQDLTYFSAMVGSFLQFNALPMVAAGAAFGLCAERPERLWRTYFVLSGLETLLTVGKLGASSNYWLELTVATSALIGVLAVRITEVRPEWRFFTSASLAAVVFAALLASIPAYQATVSQAADQEFARLNAETTPRMDLVHMIADEPGAVLTDDPGLAVEAGKRVEFEFVVFTILAAQGVWHEQPILDAIGARQFGLVVLIESLDEPLRPLISARYSENVRAALRAAYAPAGQRSGYWLYRPA